MSLFSSFKLIVLLFITCSIYSNAHKPEGMNLWCRFCSAAVGDTSQILNILSPGAMKVENRYMFGKNVTIQTLVNPFLFKFDVLTIENGSCADVGRSVGGRTWFPGYAWRICTCPRCSAQLGWTFEKELGSEKQEEGYVDINKTFHVLILKHLLGLTEDDDPGVGMLSFLKYTKPCKTSTLPSIVPRASNDTASEQNTVPLITSVVEKNNVTTESKTVTETNNSTDKGTTTIVLTTIIHNISENDIYTGNKTFTTISKYWKKNNATLAFN